MTAGLVAVYLFNLLLVGGVVAAAVGDFVSDDWLLSASALWFAKLLLEANFLFHAAELFQERHLLRYFIPTAIVHPLYIILFGFLGLFSGFQWKGEAFERKAAMNQTSHQVTPH